MAYQVFVRDDLVEVGRDWEDGTPLHARCLYLVAEASDGRRWAHDHQRLDRVHDGEADREVAALLARVEGRLAAGGELDFAHWDEIDPAYGSKAYQALDAVRYFSGRERQEARDAGEIVPVDILADAGYLFGEAF